MVAAVVGTVGAVGSFIGAQDQADAADAASRRAEQLGQQQLALGQQSMDWNKQNYNNWSSAFMPMLSQIKAQALTNMQPNYQGVIGDVGANFDAQQGANTRNMQRYGINPTDGAMSAANTAYGLGRATAQVGGMQAERNRVGQQRLANMEGVWNLGTPMMNAAQSGVNSATAGMMGALGGQQGMANQNAMLSGQAAGSLYGSAFNSLATGIGSLGGGNPFGDGHVFGSPIPVTRAPIPAPDTFGIFPQG